MLPQEDDQWIDFWINDPLVPRSRSPQTEWSVEPDIDEAKLLVAGPTQRTTSSERPDLTDLAPRKRRIYKRRDPRKCSICGTKVTRDAVFPDGVPQHGNCFRGENLERLLTASQELPEPPAVLPAAVPVRQNGHVTSTQSNLVETCGRCGIVVMNDRCRRYGQMYHKLCWFDDRNEFRKAMELADTLAKSRRSG